MALVGHFDHLQHWVTDLESGIRDYEALGFPIVRGGKHPGRGTHNAQWETAPHFIELIAVHDRAEAERGWRQHWPQIARLLAAGGAPGRFGVEVDDIDTTVARLRAEGLTLRDPMVGTIAFDDGAIGSWSLAPMQDAPAWAPFFTNYGRTPEERRRGRDRAASPWQVEVLRVETPDPVTSARWMARALGSTANGQHVPAGDVTFAFVAGPRDRIVEIELNGDGSPVGEVNGLGYRRAVS